ALDDGRVVSGVGGQYNFVAMAHALHDARSVLMLRAVHERGGGSSSNVRWSYGHATIPRHLRDIVITEYGIADLRDASDEQCAIAMIGVADAHYQAQLVAQAFAALKLERAFQPPAHWARNRAAGLRATLAPFRASGLLPDYPLGSDFTALEQRLVKALEWLKQATATRRGKAATVAAAL